MLFRSKYVFVLFVFGILQYGSTLITTLNNDNYIKIIKKATKTEDRDFMIGCLDGANQRDVSIGFMIALDDVLKNNKDKISVAYCS